MHEHLRRPVVLAATLVLASLPEPGAELRAQADATPVRDEIMRQFETSARKVVALAGAMPAETYGWRPMEGVASVADAYAHIARYNYFYPSSSLGVEAPEGVAWDTWEGTVTEKERIVEILEASMDHVRGVVRGMSDEDLTATVTLYGRQVPAWSVLLQLVAHMNEHLGQQIAYARSNRVVPPWSR